MTTTQTDDVLTVKGLKAYYKMGYFGIEREVRAVDDVTMSIRRNEIYGIAGESSSGKTSLIKTFAAAIRPPLQIVGGSMTYRFGDKIIDPYAATKAQVDAIRWKNMSYIMQGSMSVLNPVRKIRRAFRDFALRPMGLNERQFWLAVSEHLERLNLPERVLNSYPHELSGGMRQRVTIALATVCRPQFIIADEPTTALDVVVQKDVLAMIRDVQREIGSSVVFVTHDMSVHANIADRIGIVYAGRLVEEGPTRTLFTAPRHPYTAHLVASLPRIGDLSKKPSLDGRPPNLADPPKGCRFHPRCPMAVAKCATEVPPMETIGPDHRSACWRADEVRPLTTIGKPQEAGV
ncbi:ABC transporter ATP-binding protein [Roseinatronobacter sp. S2]|uniref:ABC transporter ATP-binding protein n=1 Tax=Roseinatronobacter sp. S2 TaxID=3035471 RepID=UPI00240F90FB|nr:ABC transporter ATP-binding protein [Roseinatronobacter sp. S2]WFE76923.1 ABC transporter ATP-binding protein [Roseinatronobacter sp. S2]